MITTQEARRKADTGMTMAAEHADDVTPRWTDVAEQFLTVYAVRNWLFMGEEVVEAAREWGLVEPPDARAWGAVFKRAARAGVIVKDGYGKARTSNLSMKPVWRSLVYVGGDE